MRQPVYWIVITLFLCVLMGCASAQGGNGGLSEPGPQDYSGAHSTESQASEIGIPIQAGEPSGVSSPETAYPDDPGAQQETGTGIPGSESSVSVMDTGSDLTVIASGYQGDFSAGPGDSPSVLPGGGPGNAGSGLDDHGFFHASWDSPGEGYQVGSAGASPQGPGPMDGENPAPPDPGEQERTSPHERGEAGLLQNRGGERPGFLQGTSMTSGPGGGRGSEPSAKGIEGSGQGKGGIIIPGQWHGSLGLIAASAGGAGMSRAGSEGSGGHSSPGSSPAAHGPHRQQQGIPVQYPCAPAQTTSVIPDQGSKVTDTREDPVPRARSKRARIYFLDKGPVQSPVSAPTSSPLPLFPFSLLLFGGYRRISKRNVLEHDTRQRVFSAISAYPGIDVPLLAETTGINENTLRYHLVKLVESGRITYLVKPGVIRYFLNQGSYAPAKQVLIHYLWSETPRNILLLLRSNPGRSRQQISDTLGISGPSVTRHMEHLIDDGIIENRFPGRSNHYYLTEGAKAMFEPMLSRIRAATGDGESPLVLSTPGEGRLIEPHLVS